VTEILNGDVLNREFSRTTFLKGGGAMVVGFSLAGAGLAGKAGAATGPPSPAGYLPPLNQVDSWLTINADSTVILRTSHVDVGTGVHTGFAMLVAEELDVPVGNVSHGLGDTWAVPNSGSTGGSNAIQTQAGPRIRAAAAYARQALLGMASSQLGVPVGSLTVSDGVVSGGGRSVTYGQLVGGKLFNTTMTQATLNPGVAPSKPVSQYKLIGTRVPRFDLPDKVSGKWTYVHNIKVPGMLHGRVIRPRGQGAYGTNAKILSIDRSSIKNIPGIQIVRKGDFLGVVGAREYDVIQAAAQLKVTFEEHPILPSSGNLWKRMREQDSAGKARAAIALNVGNVDTALASAHKTVSATYTYGFNGRMPIGPCCAVADVRGGAATVFSSTQGIQGLATSVGAVIGLPASQVRVIFYEGGSSFGQGIQGDVAKAAALMSQSAGKPVRVQFMRWDEHGWDNYQSAQLMDLRGGIDANGKLVAFDYSHLGQGYTSAFDLTDELIGTSVESVGARAANINTSNTAAAYALPNRRLTNKTVPVFEGYFKSGALRPGGSGMLHAFSSEQLIDELAYAAGMDPVEFRRLNILDDRWQAALEAAARAANWQPRPAASNLSKETVAKGRGFAFGRHGAAAYAAAVVELEVNRKTGKIRATHIYVGQDQGLGINPALIENQISGAAIMGLSRVLHEDIGFTTKRVNTLDWVSYPILRFTDAPKITTVAVQRPEHLPLGVGEPAMNPIAPAVANAFFDATGVRMRSAPMTPARVRAVLRAAGK
jgi:CO/xanthine dehydrogenase Mo-binding subunit